MSTPSKSPSPQKTAPQTSAIATILNQCLKLDRLMHSSYSKFAADETDPEISAFWQNVVKDEAFHIEFWNKALAFIQTSCVHVIIDNPDETIQALDRMSTKIRTLLLKLENDGSSEQKLLSAYTVEAYLFDPAFMAIFDAFRFLCRDIENQYREHIEKFSAALERFHHHLIPAQIQILNDLMLNLYTLNHKLFREAVTDPLTGLLNRRGFFNTAKPFLNLAARNHVPLGLVMMDLDDFKRLNDRFGHPAGDEALSAVGHIFRSFTRRADLVGRYGGEEFIALIQARHPESLEHFCERLRHLVETSSESLCGHPFTVSVGGVVGIIKVPDDASIHRMIAQADANLAKAKADGKNRCVLSDYQP